MSEEVETTTEVEASQAALPERESMPFDVVIVGAGPAGLSAAIRLKQINAELTVVVLEKGPGSRRPYPFRRGGRSDCDQQVAA